MFSLYRSTSVVQCWEKNKKTTQENLELKKPEIIFVDINKYKVGVNCPILKHV